MSQQQIALTKFELEVMDLLWRLGEASVRQLHDAINHGRPAYTTVQTVVYRLEAKGALRRVKKIGNAFIFEAVISRNSAHRRFVDELVGLFGGRMQPIMTHLVETGKLTVDDVREAEKRLRDLSKKGSGK